MSELNTTTLQEDQQKELTHLLITGVVHDFNNLLTTILANTSLAKQIAHPQTALYTQLYRTEKAAIQAKDLAASLLECAKGGSQVWELLDIGSLLRDVSELAFSGSVCFVKLENLEQVWPIKGQKGPLSQVFLNLLVNAIQAMPNGGEVVISGKNLPGENNQVQVTITDRGQGIKEENLARIFEHRFTTKTTGSGVGLAASKAILEKHQGQIGVKSKVGEGTSFIVLLPAEHEAVIVSKKEELGVLQLHKGSGRILLLDDDELILKTMSDMLIYLGYEVDTATRGEEAVRYFKAKLKAGESFDAVLVDLTLTKGMHSNDVIKQLYQEDPKIKIILTSGYSQEDLIRKGLRLNYDAYIQKPYTIELLSKVVKKTILEEI